WSAFLFYEGGWDDQSAARKSDRQDLRQYSFFGGSVRRSTGPRYPEDAGIGDGAVLRPASPESQPPEPASSQSLGVMEMNVVEVSGPRHRRLGHNQPSRQGQKQRAATG